MLSNKTGLLRVRLHASVAEPHFAACPVSNATLPIDIDLKKEPDPDSIFLFTEFDGADCLSPLYSLSSQRGKRAGNQNQHSNYSQKFHRTLPSHSNNSFTAFRRLLSLPHGTAEQ